MNASTLVICRDEIDPRPVRISGTNADHLVLFSDTIPLALLKEILARMERDSEATVRLKAEGTLAAVGAFVGPTRRRIAQQPGKAFSASAFSAPELLLPGRLSGVSIHHRLALGGHG